MGVDQPRIGVFFVVIATLVAQAVFAPAVAQAQPIASPCGMAPAPMSELMPMPQLKPGEPMRTPMAADGMMTTDVMPAAARQKPCVDAMVQQDEQRMPPPKE